MKPSRRSVSDIDAALTLMFEVGRIMRHAMIRKDILPLPLSYVETLKFVEESGEPTMRDVAGYLRIAAPSATAIAEALVKHGYLARKVDAKDRRVVRLALTGKGAQLLAKAARAKHQALRGLIASLSASDRKAFIRILSKIVKK
jgi:DNA-binding MarR family transcriptional regulator